MKVKSFVNNEDFSCNVFICSGEKGSFIVDSGYFDSEIEKYISTLPSLDFVIQTHGHFDHIAGLSQFHQKYPQVPVYIYKDEVDLALNPELNASRILTYSDIIPQVDFKTFKEGPTRIGKYDFQVIHTPGHTKGSCVFYFKEENEVFTGDTIIETSIGRTDLPTGDEAALFRSLNKLKKINFSDETMFHFGHGQDFSYKNLLKYNTFLR